MKFAKTMQHEIDRVQSIWRQRIEWLHMSRKERTQFDLELRVLASHLSLRHEGIWKVWPDAKIVIKRNWPVVECGKDFETGRTVYYHRGFDRWTFKCPTKKETLA
jgi:hypothetical protein